MKLKTIVLFAGIILLTGCIEIIEKVHFKKDGSGEVNYTVDASKMVEAMKSMLPDSMNEDMDVTKIQEKLDSTLDKIRAIKGISDVSGKATLGIMNYNFKFKNIDALQEAYTVFNTTTDTEKQTFWIQKGKTITRNNFLGGDSYSKMFNDTSDLSSIETYFEDAKFTQVFTFDKEVKNVNGNAVMDATKKQITNEIPFLDLIKLKDAKPLVIELK